MGQQTSLNSSLKRNKLKMMLQLLFFVKDETTFFFKIAIFQINVGSDFDKKLFS